MNTEEMLGVSSLTHLHPSESECRSTEVGQAQLCTDYCRTHNKTSLQHSPEHSGENNGVRVIGWLRQTSLSWWSPCQGLHFPQCPAFHWWTRSPYSVYTEGRHSPTALPETQSYKAMQLDFMQTVGASFFFFCSNGKGSYQPDGVLWPQ